MSVVVRMLPELMVVRLIVPAPDQLPLNVHVLPPVLLVTMWPYVETPLHSIGALIVCANACVPIA